MPNESPEIPEHYASALLSLALAANQLDEVEQDLTVIHNIMIASGDLRRFLADPMVTTEGKIEFLRQILAARVSRLTLGFVDILVTTGAIRTLDRIVDSFFTQLAARRHKVSGELVTAVPLSKEKISAIEKETSRILGKDVSLRVRIDSGILGGIWLRVGDFVIDGTIDRQLEVLVGTLQM